MLFLQAVEHDGQHDKNDGDPLGGLGQPRVQGLALVLHEERLPVAAADGAGQAGAFAALEEDDNDERQAGEKLDDRYNKLKCVQCIQILSKWYSAHWTFRIP